MRLFLIMALLLISGCTTVAGNIPTFEYCEHVEYVRDGNAITVSAKCHAPIGGPALLK